MSKDIRPGRQARAVRETHSAGGTLIPQGAVVTVQSTCAEPHLFVAAGEGKVGMTLHVEDFLFAPVYDEPAAPAPLDPSKVKAGDTVTVSGGGTGDRPAYEITGVAWEPSHSPGTLWVGPVCISAPLVTLTDHQPALEPEPEWKPGTVYDARLAGGADPFRVWAIEGDTPGTTAEFTDYLGNSYEAGELLDVRPLVVIDPAEVDVDAVSAAIYKAMYGGDWRQASSPARDIYGLGAAAALVALGIEES